MSTIRVENPIYVSAKMDFGFVEGTCLKVDQTLRRSNIQYKEITATRAGEKWRGLRGYALNTKICD